MELRPLSELLPQVERILACVMPKLAALLPGAEIHHIGATAIPGSVTKGDVDVLVLASSEQFPAAVESLKPHFAVKQPTNWTGEFASFGDDSGYELPLGIQLVAKDSSTDFLLFLRDYFIFNREALEEYNRLKLAHASEGAEEYWKAKDSFLRKILSSRGTGHFG
jgi:GrpB-like predicted nucleotidyltransferase (UPF0157 family)